MSVQAAHTRAAEKAFAAGDSQKVACTCATCKGTGKMTIQASGPGMFDDLFSELPAATAPRATQISCVDCNGSGKTNRAQVVYNKHMWCSCPPGMPERTSYASDGVKMLGKPVLMCDNCGGIHSL